MGVSSYQLIYLSSHLPSASAVMRLEMTNSDTTPDKPNVLDQVLAQRERVAARLTQVKWVVAVMSGKGGVGKSALTANLAAALSMQGRAVGVLDADIHGASAAAMLGARGQQVAIGPDGARPAIGVADVRVMSMDLFLTGDDTHVTWRHPGGLAADTFVWRGTGQLLPARPPRPCC
jgi:ATP-binding protein involved in chromosome partitioning